LNVVKIQLAPMRKPQEDIPALIDQFLARAGAHRSLTAEALEAIMS
jgi:DNA-binding NtrC family response regulator